MESQYIGDICKVKRGIVCHQVNCQKKMGKGLALQIRNKFTQHYIDFINTEPELGKVLITEISPNLYVAALYSQYHFGPKGKTYTNYGAFEKCLSELNAFATVQKLTVFLPYKIGCGLGGGDWSKIHSIIQENLEDYAIVYPPTYLK